MFTSSASWRTVVASKPNSAKRRVATFRIVARRSASVGLPAAGDGFVAMARAVDAGLVASRAGLAVTALRRPDAFMAICGFVLGRPAPRRALHLVIAPKLYASLTKQARFVRADGGPGSAQAGADGAP